MENKRAMLAGVGALYEQLAGATTVGERIQRLMDVQGITLSELSRRSKVAKGYLWELLHEATTPARRKPSAETLYALGSILGVSVGDLLGKTIPSHGDVIKWPPGLREYVEKDGVPPDAARMLASISARGRTPTTAEDWRQLHRIILMMTEERR